MRIFRCLLFLNERYTLLKEQIFYHFKYNILSTPDLVIFDDAYPSLRSPFRIAEFNAYLKQYNNCLVVTSVSAYSSFKNEFEKEFPKYVDRIFKFRSESKIKGKLAYVAFLHNIDRFLPTIEKNRLPFVFELYPGGEFRLNNDESDRKLKNVFTSSYFRKVIVTQNITKNYLLKKKLCSESDISYMYGGPLRFEELIKKNIYKKKYPSDKQSFDICFVGHKYMPMGKDKGYDIFIEVAKSLVLKHQDMTFHVVGNFNETDIDVSQIGDKIKFYGIQTIDFFQNFYSHMDIILSPNRPNTLSPGSFDAFLTGSCIEAGRCSVAVMATDELSMNDHYRDNHDIILIKPVVSDICNKIEKYYRKPLLLYKISSNLKNKLNKQYNNEVQLTPRFKLLNQIIQENN